MFRRTVTGLDIGSYSVKAVELGAGLRNVEFLRFVERRIPREATAEEREGVVQLFLEQNELSREFVVCALPPARVTQRHLRFPFSGTKRVAQALPFELEEELPLPLSQMVMTHEQVLATPDRTDVLVVLAPRSQVDAHLKELRRLEVEPRILEVEGAVLANVCSFLQLAEAGRLVADIGHNKTTLCLIVDDKPVLLRSIPIAGHQFTEAIARDLSLSYEAAEERKHEHGIFEVGTTKPVCPSIQALLERLAREMLRTVQSVVGDPLDTIAPSEMILTGGSANLEGLPLSLEEEVGLPCSVLSAVHSGRRAAALAEAGPTVFAHAAALALRGSTSGHVTQLDLRQGDFAYVPDLSGLRSQLRLAVGLFALCLVLWPLSLHSGIAAKRDFAAQMRHQLEATCGSLFPQVDCSTDPFETMQEQLRSTREIADHLGVSSDGLSALDLLRELSTRIPASLSVSLTELKIERRQIQLRGHADNNSTVGEMTQALRSFEWFQNVPDPSTVRDPRQGGVTFTLTITLQENA